jgi:hypothetical protein
MANKKLTPDEKWEKLRRFFKFDRCTLSLHSLVVDGIAMPISSFDRKLFDNETEEEVFKGRILSQNGPSIQLMIEGGEIINVEIGSDQAPHKVH